MTTTETPAASSGTPAPPTDSANSPQAPPAAEDTLRRHVRATLAHAGLSQAEAARRLDVSTKHMSQILTGRAPLKLAWAERLLALCGMRLVIALEHDRENS